VITLKQRKSAPQEGIPEAEGWPFTTTTTAATRNAMTVFLVRQGFSLSSGSGGNSGGGIGHLRNMVGVTTCQG